jgi:phosphoribosylanthranilate isomerase
VLASEDFIVKVCGITTEADALMCVSQGANAIGFVFAPSIRQMVPSEARDIVKRLPEDVTAVGVFRNEDKIRVIEIAEEVGLTAVQLHGLESVEEVAFLRDFIPTVIRALPAESPSLREFDHSHADFLLLDGENPGSGESHEWGRLGRTHMRTPVIAAGGLNPFNVGEVARTLPVRGVDVSTGVEAGPGRKDPELVSDFIRAARHGYVNRLPSVGNYPMSEED